MRKEIELLAEWKGDQMLDLNSQDFMDFADGVEKKVSRGCHGLRSSTKSSGKKRRGGGGSFKIFGSRRF